MILGDIFSKQLDERLLWRGLVIGLGNFDSFGKSSGSMFRGILVTGL